MATLMLVPLVPAAASGGTPIASDPAVVTRLTLEAQSSSRVWPLRLTGRLTDGAFNGLSGETVAFETSADGADWEATATAVTDESGSISIVTWLARTMLFRATYAGETGIYLPCASDVTTAGYIPNLSWVTTPPASVAVNRTFAVAATVDVPEHACVGKLKCERLRPGTYVVLERRNVAIQGRWNAKDGRFEYAGSASLPTAGDWRVSFELPRDSTHELVGVTTEGIYHVRNCDLNASQFVNERAERAELWNLLEADSLQIKKGLSLPQAVIDTMKAMAEKMIPKIPYLSGDALEKQRARKKALAAI